MVGHYCLRLAKALVFLIVPTIALAEDAPRFALPVACELGRNCFIQNYVDADPTASSRDHQCGTLSYDGHNGTDFRIPTMAAQRAGVDVLAAAAGKVLRRREGVADGSVRGNGAASVKGVECGNAVLIEHADGWQTQYCHMARGSLRVEVGDRVEAGQPIGRIGLSGLTEYPHLHFIVRHRGEIADPFAYEASPNACGGGRILWDPALAPLLGYKPRSVLNAGFAVASVSMASLEAGEAEQKPGIDAPALVAYVRAIGLKAGDIQSLVLSNPAGQVVARHDAKKLERHQAQSLVFAGARKPPAGWEKGTYRVKYLVSQDGKAVLEKSFDLDLR
jgi:murein DD-endopeptidase MepM/ murein hydrolase activator NlpD